MKKINRLLSMLLAIAMFMSLLPAVSFATEPELTEPTIFTIDFSEYTTPATAITTNGAKIGPKWTYKSFAGDGWSALLNVSDSTIYASTVSGGTNVKYMVDQTNGDYLGFDILNNETYGYNVDNGYNTFSLDLELPASGIYDISAGIRNLTKDYGYVQMEIDGVDIGKIENSSSGDMNGNATTGEGLLRQEREFSKGAGVALTAGHHTMKLEFTQYTEGQTRLQPGLYDIIFTPTIFTIDFSEYTTPRKGSITTNGAKIGPEWTHKAFAGDGWTALLNASDSTIYASTEPNGTNVKYMVDQTNGDYLGFDIQNNETYGYNVDNGYNTFSLDFELPASSIYDISSGIRNLTNYYGYVQMEIDGVDIGKIENSSSGDMNGNATTGEGLLRQEREFSKGAGVALAAGHHTMKLKFTQYTEDQERLQPGLYDIIFTAVASPAEPDDDSELEEAFTAAFDAEIDENIEYSAPTVTGVTMDNDVIDSTPGTVTGAINLTADEVNKDGKNFLYWAKAMTLSKKIISFSNELTNYMPGVNDKNEILIAVYEGDVPEQEEWYNANGQRIATDAQPALPSMAGYGEAEGWDDYTDKIHVARYASKTPTAGIDVTVKGDNTSGGGTNLTYGAPVTCTATGDNFKCWTKSDINGNTEIVSVDKTYKFQAWETCTVTAIYDDDYTYNGNTMKIILDQFTVGTEKAVMAEFIGFGNKAVEKGIIWNGTKIAMTKPGTQFTLTGNVGDTFTGYAIVDNDDGTHNEVTDGSVTID